MLHDPLTQLVIDQQHVNPVLGWSPCADLEYQVNGAEREYRNVLNGSTDPELKSNIPDWIPGQVTLLGCSGWDVVGQRSVWGGIDLDAVAGHATTGLSPERLAEYVAALPPYCQVQRSKSGEGYHIFFRFGDRPRAFTRSDHKRNCKRVVMRIQDDIGMPLLSDADVYGGNMWLWWSQRNSESFEVISGATAPVPSKLPELPPPEPAQNNVDVTDWDDKHHALIEEAGKSGYAVITEHDSAGNPCLRLHTCALKGLNAIGTYDTVSPGNDPKTPNGFAYPIGDGGLLVGRFGDAKECEPWFEKDGRWYCLFNVPVNPHTAADDLGIDQIDGVWTGSVKELAELIRQTGTEVPIDGIEDDDAELKHDGDKLILSKPHRKGDLKPDGWKKKGRKVYFTAKTKVNENDPRLKDEIEKTHFIMDTQPDGTTKSVGFLRDGEYFTERELTLLHASKGIDSQSSLIVKSSAMDRRLTKRVRHFADDRIDPPFLNEGARITVTPVKGEHPTWDALDGIFDVLTPHLPDWYLENGITTGGLVARTWTALMIREHDHPLYMLALFSKLQGTAKSSWANSRKMCFDGGQAFANGMLSRNSQFNAHVLRAVFAHIEECDIRGCYDIIKPLISDEQAECEAKHVQAGVADNRCHFVQTTNRMEYIPMDPDDTRIVVVSVEPFKEPLQRKVVKRRLMDELPHYLYTLMEMSLPDPAPGIEGRLYMPMIHTPARQLLMDLHDPVARFVRDYCKPGKGIPSTEFDGRFQRWQQDIIGEFWPATRIHRSLPDGVTYRTTKGNAGEIMGVKWTSA